MVLKGTVPRWELTDFSLCCKIYSCHGALKPVPTLHEILRFDGPLRHGLLLVMVTFHVLFLNCITLHTDLSLE